MKKSSPIRQHLEKVGFQQLGNNNKYISYYVDYCFIIEFNKASYGMKWEILYLTYMSNAKNNSFGIYPDRSSLLHGSFQGISLSSWVADKDRHPDRHSESINFILDIYILPIFSNIAFNKKLSDFESYQYIEKADFNFNIDDHFIFRPISGIRSYTVDELRSSSDTKSIFDFLQSCEYEFINKQAHGFSFMLHFQNKNEANYIILIIQDGLFLSIEVSNEEDYLYRPLFGNKQDTMTDFKDDRFSFGWLIGNRENNMDNISKALTALKNRIQK